MNVGVGAGYWGAGPPSGVVELLRDAELWGVDSFWTAEAYGSDALTPLAWWGSATTSIKLGTSICQMSARTPTALAMAAMTIDHLSGGRVLLGIGASGPQVVEGWYGQPYPKPLERTREYVDIMRRVMARDVPVTYDGRHYQLPLDAGTHLGKALRSTIHPWRPSIPILLAAEGPKNVALAAEIADGWLPIFYAPAHDEAYRKALAEGFSRPEARRRPDDFEVIATATVMVSDDIEEAADAIRPFLALYIGGMGARDVNFHFQVFARMGFEAEAKRIQDLYLDGHKAEAAAAVPTSLVEATALIGPKEKIRDDLEAWTESPVTTLLVGGGIDQMRLLAELVG